MKLENKVIRVSVNVSRSVLSKKTGQLACISVKNGVLKPTKKGKKVYSIINVFFLTQ